jgi:lysozyme
VRSLEDDLLRDEDERLQIYDDATGKPLKAGVRLLGVPTIGVGINLLNITQEESRWLLRNRIARMRKELADALPWYQSLSPVRQLVLENMCFNMGLTRFLGFKKETLPAIKAGDYDKAAKLMLKSKWARQVGARAKRLSEMMRTDTEVA